MSREVKRRRGTTEQHNSFIGAEGELTVDTDKKTVIVHDGVTAGGESLTKNSDFDNHSTQHETGGTDELALDADKIVFNPATSDLTETNTQGAIDELDDKVETHLADYANLFATEGEVF